MNKALVNSISDNWNVNLQPFNQEKNEALVPVFYADWTSVPAPLNVKFTRIGRRFHSPSVKGDALYGEK